MADDIVHPELLASIRAACAKHGLSESAFGRGAIKDDRLVANLVNGRELRVPTLKRVEAYLASLDTAAPSPAAAETAR